MKILITYDDSISSEVLFPLAKWAKQFGEVTVVAPSNQCSAMSSKLTIRGSLRVDKVEDFPVPVKAAYKVNGTPVDCVKVALHYILEEKPDYVFSGINDGYNVGYDIAYSGTLGAAFEAVMQGIPAMAFSNTMKEPMNIAEKYLTSIIQELIEKGQGIAATRLTPFSRAIFRLENLSINANCPRWTQLPLIATAIFS